MSAKRVLRDQDMLALTENPELASRISEVPEQRRRQDSPALALDRRYEAIEHNGGGVNNDDHLRESVYPPLDEIITSGVEGLEWNPFMTNGTYNYATQTPDDNAGHSVPLPYNEDFGVRYLVDDSQFPTDFDFSWFDTAEARVDPGTTNGNQATVGPEPVAYPSLGLGADVPQQDTAAEVIQPIVRASEESQGGTVTFPSLGGSQHHRPSITKSRLHTRYPAGTVLTLTPRRIPLGAGSGSDLMALFGDETEPRTKWPLIVDRARVGKSVYPNYPAGDTVLPAHLTLDEIAKRYANHVWGQMLRVFVAEGWDAPRIYNALPQDARAKRQKGRPWNFLQHGIGREQDHIYFEVTGHKRQPRKKAEAQVDGTKEDEGQEEGDGLVGLEVQSPVPVVADVEPCESLEQASSRLEGVLGRVFDMICRNFVGDLWFSILTRETQAVTVEASMLQELAARCDLLRQVWNMDATGDSEYDGNLFHVYRDRLLAGGTFRPGESADSFADRMSHQAIILTANDIEAMEAGRESEDVAEARTSGRLKGALPVVKQGAKVAEGEDVCGPGHP
ncbi:hypothetical protein B0A52_06154 [Exophiala mesophila]|uniref:Uncharacterized protein n=1 Tax=Exophiala mesophila TaxID=212818 RepID=A0A438N5I4_EXOME|nr:hypothetical protein B0A52_06154 [Exophiala mesophila]